MEMYTFNNKGNDVYAARSFIYKFRSNGYRTNWSLKNCSLYEAIYSLLLKKNRGKILMLHFNNPDTELSRNFCSSLADPILQLIGETFDLLGWDIQEDTYEEDMIRALDSIEGLRHCVEILKEKKSALFFIALINLEFRVFFTITSLSKSSNLLDLIMDYAHSVQQCITEAEENTTTDHEATDDGEMSFMEFQQEMFDVFGDRDYDLYESDQLEFLKQKINFALKGPPKEIDEKESEETMDIFRIILAQSNEFSQYENEVVMSIVYNCLMREDAKNVQEFVPIPVFILRKCHESDNPCRIIIDHSKRVYRSWRDYLENNKLDPCLMIFPEDGRYSGNRKGDVILNKAKSPACKLGKKLIKATDTTSTVLGLGSSGVLLAAAVPAITVAPLALAGAVGVGIGVGAYSIVRSIGTLIDRGKHKESFSIKEPEARGAYLNIAAGTVGFATAGASAVVSKMAASGSSVGMVTRATANTLGVANIGISGLAVGNSSAEMLFRWIKHDEKPSALVLLQLSTSILFFGHAVYSFKTANTIIEESQTSTLNSFKESLRSNRHRKTFKKLELETTRSNNGNIQKGRAEVISSVIRLKNKDEVFAFLTRSNKKFNELGIKFSAQDGNIMLNGNKPLDLVSISENVSSDVFSYFADLPQKLDNDNQNPSKLSKLIQELEIGLTPAVQSITRLEGGTKIFLVCKELLQAKYPELVQILEEFRRNVMESREEIWKLPLSFISKKVQQLLERCNTSPNSDPLNFLFKNLMDLKYVKKKSILMGIICDYILKALKSNEFTQIIQEFVSHVKEMIISVIFKREESEEREEKVHLLKKYMRSKRRKVCEVCSGYYFV